MITKIFSEMAIVILSILITTIFIFNNSFSTYIAIVQNPIYLLGFLLIMVLSSIYTIFAVIKGKKLVLKKILE